VFAVSVLIAPVLGRELGSGAQTQGSAGGRGASSQTPPANQGKVQTPTTTPQAGQTGPRQQPSAEQFLGWDWWTDEAVQKEMKLTPAQVRSITQVFNRNVQNVKPLYEEYLKQLSETDRMSRERTADVSIFEMQVIRVESLRSKLNETRTVMLYRIYKMLDPSQYEKLREIRDRRWAGRGRGAPPPRSW
jgi:hypothetical protein